MFAHLKDTQTKPGIELPTQNMTWVKFLANVLPQAASIKAVAPSHGHYIAITTAADPDAKPILRWDTEERRNPFAHYVYSGGSSASRWSLKAGELVTVTAITASPSNWFGGQDSIDEKRAIFLLEGAVDKRISGSALFPETLKSDLHGIRSVIEAHSNKTPLGGIEEASACGFVLTPNSPDSPFLDVTDFDGNKRRYRIDRWD